MAEGAPFALYARWTPSHEQLRYGRSMSTPDFNLLVTLDVLLAEGSVARAAQRLRLSPSSMSRAAGKWLHCGYTAATRHKMKEPAFLQALENCGAPGRT